MALIGILAAACLGFMYADSLRFMVDQWGSDDYSHGFFVPVISVFLIWQRRHRVASIGVRPSWWGLPIVLFGLTLYVIGDYATLYVLLHLSLWIVVVGLTISLIGPLAAREIAFPFSYLLTSIPLPVYLHSALSSRLQLWSSALGVGCLQIVGVTAFREGNVIDLGPVQLQVAEACSGIRYLFPLTALALLCAYLYRDRMWKRIVLLLSALPISVLVNGLRIGIVGILVELYGPQAAEGLLHLFEGWVLFMATLGILLVEMWGLSRIHPLPGNPRFSALFTWQENTGSGSKQVPPVGPVMGTTRLAPAYLCSVALLVPFAALSGSMGERQETPPDRAPFVDFSMQIGEWRGSTLSMESQYISTLRFDDYLLADYVAADGRSLNFYVAYYRSQKKGQSAHSPQSCIPGGGWEIISRRSMGLSLPGEPGSGYPANLVLIHKDHQKQVVLYWFKQRERLLSNEYLVKFYLFWDALAKGRSDGALIRLAASVEPGETVETVERRLTDFARIVRPELARYVPD